MNINEHLWSGIIHRSESGKERKEIINYIGKTKEGEKLFLPLAKAEEGTVLELDDKKCFQIEELEDCYFCVVRTESGDFYYRYESDEDARFDDKSNMISWFTSTPNLEKNNFVWLRAFITATDRGEDATYMNGILFYDDNLDIHSIRIENSYDGSFYGFDSEDVAEKFAIKQEKNHLENFLKKSKYNEYLDEYGYDFFDIDEIKSNIETHYKDSFNWMGETEIIKELLDNEIVYKDDDFFEEDDYEEGIDITKPKFDPYSYADEYVEHKMICLGTNQDYVEEYDRIVDDDFDEMYVVIDFWELARLIVNDKGIAKIIANEDTGIEKEATAVKDGVKYYFYRSDI